MALADVSVRRPVFAIMMTAALIVLGAFSYTDLGIDEMAGIIWTAVALQAVALG